MLKAIIVMLLIFYASYAYATGGLLQLKGIQPTSFLLLFNGTDRLLLVDGASKLCLSNGC